MFGEEDVRFVARSVEAAARSGRAVVLNMSGCSLGDISQIPGTGFQHPRGSARSRSGTSRQLRPDYVKAIFDRQSDIAVANLQKINAACGGMIDVVYVCGTDFGHQAGQFCRAGRLREVWLPYYRKMNDWIHANTKWKTFKHSCGAVVPLIPCFIECGFDTLNPVQTSAAGMDPAIAEAGIRPRHRLLGGGIDTQQVLPFGTPAEVRKQVLERCEIFGRDGGFVFNAIHNIQLGVPVETSWR